MYFEAMNVSLVSANSDLFRPIRPVVLSDRFRGLVVAAFCCQILWFPIALQAAQSYALQDFRDSGELSRVKVSFDVQGHLYETGGPKTKQSARKIQVRVAARLTYDEKLPSETAAGEPNSWTAQPAARYYHQARAQMHVGSRKDSPTLRSDRRTIVAEPNPGGLTLFSPQGPLTRSELDLVDLPVSSHLLYSLLPPDRVKVGQSWRHDDDVFAPIARVQSVTSNTMKSTLTAIQKSVARVRLKGKLRGHGPGADTELEISGEYRFDLRQRRITWIQMSISERRPGGYTQPGFQVNADLRMLITPCKESSPLDSVDWPSLLASDVPTREIVKLSPEGGYYELYHDRRWHVMADGPDGVTLRFVDSGDMLAQCNISHLTPLPTGKQIGLEQFQQDVQRAVAKRFGQLEQARQVTDEEGRRVLRVAALGKVDGIAIRWVHYHISDQAGHRAACVFTMEADLAERFAEADEKLVGSFRFAEREMAERSDSTAAADPRGKPVGASTSASGRKPSRAAGTAKRGTARR